MTVEEDLAKAKKLLEDAVFLREYGERPDGAKVPPGEPRWIDWDFVTYFFLKRLNTGEEGALAEESEEFLRGDQGAV
jgi:hypothetical protein